MNSQVIKKKGRYLCDNKHCSQWTSKGCKLRKVGLTCDNMECEFNVSPIPGVYQCGCMDVHLDADGKCMGAVCRKGSTKSRRSRSKTK